MVASFEAYLVDGQPEKALNATRYEIPFAPELTGVVESLERALSIPAEGSIELAWIEIRMPLPDIPNSETLRGQPNYLRRCSLRLSSPLTVN